MREPPRGWEERDGEWCFPKDGNWTTDDLLSLRRSIDFLERAESYLRAAIYAGYERFYLPNTQRLHKHEQALCELRETREYLITIFSNAEFDITNRLRKGKRYER